MFLQLPIDPNELIDPTGVGWEEGVLAAVVLGAAYVLGILVRRLVSAAALRWSDTQPDFALFVGKLAGWFVMVLGLAAALMILGIQLGPIILIVGVVALILALSARDLLENFGAGIVLQSENPFHTGDLVEIADLSGTVRNIKGRTTVLDTYDGKRVRIPNSQVLGASIVNLSERDSLRSEIQIGLEYGTDLDEAKAVMLDTLKDLEGVMTDPGFDVFVLGFGPSSINFLVRFWHRPKLQTRDVMVDRVVRALDRALRKEGFAIAFPQMVVWSGGQGHASGSQEP